MKFKDILKEFFDTIHVKDRLEDRLLRYDNLNVIAVPSNEPQREILIGYYTIPESVKNKIRGILDKINNPYYTVPKDHAVIVELHTFDLYREKIDLIKPRYITFFKDKKWRVYLQPPITPKNSGYYLVCIIRNNAITTVFFSRTKDLDYIKRKMRQNYGVKEFSFVKDVDNDLDRYIDIDILRSEKPRQITPEPTPAYAPQEPELTDKERRFLAYKERMKKLSQKRK